MKSKYIRWFVVAVLLLAVGVINKPIYSQASDIDIDFSMVEVPEEAKAAFVDAIANRPVDTLQGEHFVVTWFVQEGEWAVAMVTSWGNGICTPDFLGAGSACYAKLLLHKASEWAGAFSGTADYLNLSSQASRDFVYRYDLYTCTLRSPSFERTTPLLKSPWHYSQTWRITKGFHRVTAIDIAPTGGSADLYAPTDGRLSVQACEATMNVTFSYEGGSTQFFHLDRATLVAPTDRDILQGTKIGTFYDGIHGRGWYENRDGDYTYESCTPEPGTSEYYGNCDSTDCCYYKYKDSCGIGTGLHAHWLLPARDTVFDGWTVGESDWANLPSSNGLRIQVEIPDLDARVGGRVQFQGWALDPNETNSSGIDWLRLCFGGKVGDEGVECLNAEYGDETLDIGQAYGQQYNNSGWHVWYDLSDLDLGEQDIYIYANDDRAYITHTIVHELAYEYAYKTQTPPPSLMISGEQVDVSFTLTNTGDLQWEQSIVKLGTDDNPDTPENERNWRSVFWRDGTTGWDPAVSNRILLQETTVPLQTTGTFSMTFTAPVTLGIQREHFRPVAHVDGKDLWMESGPGLWLETAVCREDYDPDIAGHFCDVPNDHTFFTATQAIATPGEGEEPLTGGCRTEMDTDGDKYVFYCPDDVTTRDKTLVMINRWLYQIPTSDLPDSKLIRKVFSDLEEKTNYDWDPGLRAIQLSFLDGGISGFSDGTMKPDEDVHRADALLMVMKALAPQIDDEEAAELIERYDYTDVSVPKDPVANPGSYHVALLIRKAAQLRITHYDSEIRKFFPDDKAPRSHIAAFLYRAFLRDCRETPDVDDCRTEEDKAANAELRELRSQARITDDEGMLCFSASKAADDKLRAKGLPYIGIFTDTDDGMEVCYCGGDAIYSTNRCADESHTITPDGATLSFEETRGENTLETTVQIPAGAVPEETTLRYMEVVNLSLPHSGFHLSEGDQSRYSGRAFKFEAYRQSQFIENFRFDKPITITLSLDNIPVSNVDDLQLLYWDHEEQTWLNALEVGCGDAQPKYNEMDHTVSFPVCHLTEFALYEITPQTVHTLIPFDNTQDNYRQAYQAIAKYLYHDGHTRWAASIFSTDKLGEFNPGTFVLPHTDLRGDYRYFRLTELPTITRAYAPQPRRIALLRATITVPVAIDDGYVTAMWELAHIRQVLDGYLMGAVPYDILTEDQVAANLSDYDMLIIPAFRNESRDAVLDRLTTTGALDAMGAFVANGGTLYAQGSGLEIAEQAGALPLGAVDLDNPLRVVGEDYVSNRGTLSIVQPDSPLAYSWIDDGLYILDDPMLYLDETTEVIANLINVDTGEGVGEAPAIIRHPSGKGQVIGVVGHPTDPMRRDQGPVFMNALLLAISGRADFYGDAVQTFNPDYPAHEFPAYEVVPVSETLHVENLWDKVLYTARVTETVSPGYNVLADTVQPAYTKLFTAPRGSSDPRPSTIIVWDLGDLDPHAHVTLSFQSETDPETLAAGIDTFSRGELSYLDLPAGMETVFLPTHGKRVTAHHPPFVLEARMAARLVGDRDLEGDRHYRIPEDGIYLDMALPLENKEETLASSVHLTDWVYLLSPIVDYENQHVILNTNDGETVWMRNEPYLWDDTYPMWEGATAPTQTITLDDWQGDWCVFTSTYGIHTDPPPQRGPMVEDYGSFITIPVGYEDVISVTAQNELLLPCYPLKWDLGEIPGYWYEEPAVRYGVHSRELFGREVVFHGTPREDTVVMPYDAGSVYVAAGTETVPFREHLEAATPYNAKSPTLPELRWQDVWLRPHTMTLRATFYDVWAWDSCGTCDGRMEQHAGTNLTYGMVADLDGDGVYETPVKEIPTRLAETKLRLLGKTYSGTQGDPAYTIPAGQNLIQLPIFKGLGIKINPEFTTWWDSYRSLGPGNSELITVSEQVAYDHLFFQQDIPDGSWAAFMISATIGTYDFNREGQFKIHDGTRLVYRQMHAGPNRYEVYDSHVHVPEGWSSDGQISKRGGPTAVSIYNDTVFFIYNVWDEYDAREFGRRYDPYMKSWGYGDAVWTTYVGGREEKTLYHPVLGPGEKTRVRVAFDNNTGNTVANLDVQLDLPEGFTAALLYEDPDTAPEPIWPELAFLNRTEVPDAVRSVWYFDLTVGDVDPSLWGQVLEIPVVVSGDGLPADYVAPPARIALHGYRSETSPNNKTQTSPNNKTQTSPNDKPHYTSGLADSLVLTDALPSEVVLESIAWVTDTATLDELQRAMDADAGDFTADAASEIYARFPVTFPFTQEWVSVGDLTQQQIDLTQQQITVDLPEALQQLPPVDGTLTLVGKAKLTRARHGLNVVNEGAAIRYTDPFGVEWTAQADPVTVEAHGAAVWVDYYCEGGWGESEWEASLDVTASEGECYIPDYGPAEVVINVTAYNVGDAIARGVTTTLALPTGVTVTDAIPPWHDLYQDNESEEETGGYAVWKLGDLAPGAWREFTIILYVEPVDDWWGGEAIRPTAVTEAPRVLGIHHTDGEFIDGYSEQLVEAQIGDAFWLHVQTGGPRETKVYLPILMRSYDTRADLVITDLSVNPDDPADVQVVIANEGLSAAEGFWVDLYLDPSHPPEAGQAWTDLCDPYGLAWQVSSLASGESLTLTLDSSSYGEAYSAWPVETYPAGDHEIWTYVDSLSQVSEINEDNNRAGPVSFTGPENVGDTVLTQPRQAVPPRPRP